MKLKSDEQRLLTEAKNGSLRIVKTDRQLSIVSKFKSLGLMTDGDKLTPRGLHVASSISQEPTVNAEVYGQDGPRVASQSRSNRGRRNSAGPWNPDSESGKQRPNAETANKSGNLVGGDVGDLSGPNAGTAIDPRAISETTAFPPGSDAVSD